MYAVPIGGTSINTAQISIETTITSGNISCTNISGVNATFNQLETVTFNPANLNTSNVDTQNLNVVNSIPLLNVSVLNASQKNVSNMSVENLSVGTITADNISTGALIPGTNINISGNVISAENEALLPANANFSSVNSCSLAVTGTTILGGTTYLSDSLIVTNAVNCSSITANNLSTGDMEITSPLTYNSSTKQLSCEVLTTPVSGSTLPVSSGALYNVLGNISEQASLMHTSLYRRGLVNYDVTIANTSLGAGVSGYLFYIDYHPKFEDSLIKATAFFSYAVGGSGSDNIEFKMLVGTTNNTFTRTEQVLYQQWGTSAGSGTRSSAGGSIGCVYPNEDTITSGLFHRIHVYLQNNGNDTFALTDSGNYISIEVLETLDTQQNYNNNIRIGTGNISANNMSLTGSLSVNPGSGFGTPVKIGRTTIGNVSFDNMLSLGVDNSTTGTTYGFGQVANNQTIMNSMSSTTHNSFRVENVEVMRNTSVGLGIKTLTDPTHELEVNGTITCTTFQPTNLNASEVISNTMLIQSRATLNNVDVNGDVEIRDFGSLSSFNNSFNNVSANNLSLGNVTATNITATTISATNLSTASLTAGTNISILNGSISAYVEGGTEWDVSSIHVDNDVEIFGNLNVSETSTFEQSLNVENQLFVGNAGSTDGSIVLYSTGLGDNLVISNNVDDTCSIIGQGLTEEINISLGGNEIVEFLNNTVNINGRLNVSNISINSSVDVAELTTSEINISDTTNTSQYTRIHRQGDQTFFVGNNVSQGCDYKFYTGTNTQNLALEINRSLTTTINRLEVVSTMESVNICTDNNISVGGSLSVVGNISSSEITTPLLVSEKADFNNVSIVGDVEIMILGSLTSYNNSFDNIHSRAINCSDSLIVHGNVSIDANGNISCKDISCESCEMINFSAELAFIDNLYIEGVNNKALIAMGYTPTGIVSESVILMASGGTGDGTVELDNGSTEFNISSRGTGKTFRFSSGQIARLEVNDTNTSCMDLVVNGDIDTTGNINSSGTLSATVLEADDANIELVNCSNLSAIIAEISTLNGDFFSVSTLVADDFVNNTEMRTPLINCSTINASTINIANIGSTNISTTNLSVTKGSFSEITFPVIGPYLYFNPLSKELNVSVRAIEDDIFGGNINVSSLNASTVLTQDITFNGALFTSGTIDWRSFGCKVDTFTLNASFSNASFLDAINASVSNDLQVDGQIDAFDLVSDTGSIGVLDSTTINLSGNLNVSGFSYFQENGIFFDNIIMYGDFLALGDVNGGTDSELYIYSATAGDNMRMGHANASEFRFKLSNATESMNFVIFNSSILVLDSNEARFHKNVNLSYTLSATVLQADDANVELVNCSNLSALVGEISTLNGDFFSVSTLVADDFINNTEMRTPLINVSTINASTINSSNFSTASMLFSSDFQFSLNTLSLAPSETSAAIQSATLASIAVQVDSQTGNFSTINADFGTIGGALNANILNVSTLNYSSATGINLNATNISVGASGSVANILLASTAFGHNNFFNSNDVAIHQFSGGSTHINCVAGGGVAIRSGGVDIANFNTTNVSLNYPLLTDSLTSSLINNHQNYIRYTNTFQHTLSSSQTFYDVQFTGNDSRGYKPNSSLITDQNTRSQFTIQKAGYYRFFCHVPVFNVTYGNRVVYRLRPVVIGATNTAYGEGYCYTRHNSYGNRGTVTGEVLRLFAVGNTVRFRLDCGKASFGSTFGNTMDGLQVMGGRYLEIQFLGEN